VHSAPELETKQANSEKRHAPAYAIRGHHAEQQSRAEIEVKSGIA
jgi:hypothetical protein